MHNNDKLMQEAADKMAASGDPVRQAEGRLLVRAHALIREFMAEEKTHGTTPSDAFVALVRLFSKELAGAALACCREPELRDEALGSTLEIITEEFEHIRNNLPSIEATAARLRRERARLQ